MALCLRVILYLLIKQQGGVFSNNTPPCICSVIILGGY